LAAQYDNFGVPAYGMILYDGEPNSFAERSIGKNPQLLDYLHTSSILDQDRTAATLRTIWDQYIGVFENQIIPKALQDSILSVAEEKMGLDGVHFISRLLVNLMSDINISWLESVAIKWSPFLEVVHTEAPAVLKQHHLLNNFVELCDVQPTNDSQEVISFIGGKGSLPKKVNLLAKYFDSHRRGGSLEEQLRLISNLNKPGAPKLIRHIGKNADRILEFQFDANNLSAMG
jgi:hypothetical protein